MIFKINSFLTKVISFLENVESIIDFNPMDWCMSSTF